MISQYFMRQILSGGGCSEVTVLYPQKLSLTCSSNRIAIENGANGGFALFSNTQGTSAAVPIAVLRLLRTPPNRINTAGKEGRTTCICSEEQVHCLLSRLRL